MKMLQIIVIIGLPLIQHIVCCPSSTPKTEETTTDYDTSEFSPFTNRYLNETKYSLKIKSTSRFCKSPHCKYIGPNYDRTAAIHRSNICLKKSVWLVTNTTTASKYIPKRTRICIN